MISAQRHAVVARTIFDGQRLHADSAVIIENECIAAIARTTDIPSHLPRVTLPENQWLVPGFIDIQVNGGGDVLFNDAPTPQTIATIAAAHRRFGTTALLPTLITDTDEKMRQALEAVRQAVAEQPSVLGIHFEGPFLSPEKAGVHDPKLMRSVTPWHRDLLTSLKTGVTLVTCAPECVPPGFIAELAQAGVRVALGHSMATYEQTRDAIAEGLTGFTHLFNAMRPLTSREPGPIAAALESRGCWYGLIADGVHVAPAMLRLALCGLGTPMLVTDAMPPVGGKENEFVLYGNRIAYRDGRCVTNDGTLAGSGIDMASAVRNAVRLLNLELTEALRLASLTPAQFLGMDDTLGRLVPGYRADMVALDPASVAVGATWVAGDYQPAETQNARPA